MLLKASPVLSILSPGGVGDLFPPSNVLFPSTACRGSRLSVRAAKGTSTKSLTGVVFEPFEEVKKDMDLLVPTTPMASLARHHFSDDSESAVNEQIK